MVSEIGSVEDSVHGDERPGIGWKYVWPVELIIRCVSDVLDLAAQIVAHPNVSKRTCRGDIRKWSHSSASGDLLFLVGFVRRLAGFIASRHHVAPAEATTSAMAARIVNFVILVLGRMVFTLGSAF